MVDNKGASAAEASNGGNSVLHVSTDQVNVIYLHGTEMVPCYYHAHKTQIHNGNLKCPNAFRFERRIKSTVDPTQIATCVIAFLVHWNLSVTFLQ